MSLEALKRKKDKNLKAIQTQTTELHLVITISVRGCGELLRNEPPDEMLITTEGKNISQTLNMKEEKLHFLQQSE